MRELDLPAAVQFVTQDPLVNSSPVMVNGTLYVSGTTVGTVPELYVFDLVPLPG